MLAMGVPRRRRSQHYVAPPSYRAGFAILLEVTSLMRRPCCWPESVFILCAERWGRSLFETGARRSLLHEVIGQAGCAAQRILDPRCVLYAFTVRSAAHTRRARTFGSALQSDRQRCSGVSDEWHLDFRNIMSYNTLWKILRLINTYRLICSVISGRGILETVASDVT